VDGERLATDVPGKDVDALFILSCAHAPPPPSIGCRTPAHESQSPGHFGLFNV
jgi:hypothetical protein